MFPLPRFRVEDSSMEPTLRPGDRVLVNGWAYRIRDPTPGDVVVLRHPRLPGKFLVKRIAARTAAGDLVVLGDNETRSEDSRRFGPVPRASLLGKAWFRYWPPDRAGLLRA